MDRGGLAGARCHRHRLTVIAILRLRPQADLVTWTPTLIADAAGLNGFLAILHGTITGVGGGVLRDILTGIKPIFLVESTPLRASLEQLCCSCSSRLECTPIFQSGCRWRYFLAFACFRSGVTGICPKSCPRLDRRSRDVIECIA
ncbi:MAG: TRIC cation channel family protein, partial [Candidatus Nanopelagicales bacterium]